MAKRVTLYNPRTGQRRTAYQGFSWTTLFFGVLPALFRGDGRGALIMFLIALPTFGLAYPVFAFLYNAQHLRRMTDEGFVLEDAYADGEVALL